MSEVNFSNKKSISEGGSESERFLAEKNGERYFLKEYQDQRQLRREYVNQSFLCQISKEGQTGFEFLQPKKTENTLYYSELGDDFRWLASGPNAEDEIEGVQEYFEPMLEFFQFCHRKINFEDLPKDIQRRYEQKGDQHYLDNFDKDSKYLKNQGLINTGDRSNLRDILAKNIDQRAFQHHDVVPWHMAKNKESGEIILVDAEWADWSLWAYDIAYYILQMVGYADQVEDAETVYKKVKQEYSNKDNFDELLHCALVYRGTRLAAELHRADEKKNLDKVIEITVKGGFE
ncbi:MAG: hypothetical protein ABEI74_00345 [Candidatus Pacearchaeota archaeon]